MNVALSAAKHGSTAEWTQFEIVKATAYSTGKTSGKIPTDISVTEEEWDVLRLISIERYKNGCHILTMPKTKSVNSFTDVSASSEYAQAVAWAVENGVTSGTSATTFSPDNTCTRGQIVTFLHRALK